MSDSVPRLTRIAVYPIKSLDPVEVERSEIVANGGLEHDREWAIFDEDGRYVNGKRTPDVHAIRASFDDEMSSVRLRDASRRSETVSTSKSEYEFDLENPTRLNEWLSDYFGYSVSVERDTRGGFPDDTTLSGPTLISTGTLREVASWFPGIDEHGMSLRLRANLEVSGVPPFWEDRLFSDHNHCVEFRIGDVRLKGINPCQRCVVPKRNPHTGEEYDGFQETFVEKREETLPDWTNTERLDHYFRVMINTRVPEVQWGSELEVGDEVQVVGERPLDPTLD